MPDMSVTIRTFSYNCVLFLIIKQIIIKALCTLGVM